MIKSYTLPQNVSVAGMKNSFNELVSSYEKTSLENLFVNSRLFKFSTQTSPFDWTLGSTSGVTVTNSDINKMHGTTTVAFTTINSLTQDITSNLKPSTEYVVILDLTVTASTTFTLTGTGLVSLKTGNSLSLTVPAGKTRDYLYVKTPATLSGTYTFVVNSTTAANTISFENLILQEGTIEFKALPIKNFFGECVRYKDGIWEVTNDGTVYYPINTNGNISHEVLTNLQGGTTGEHYHMTQAQHDVIGLHNEMTDLQGGATDQYYHLDLVNFNKVISGDFAGGSIGSVYLEQQLVSNINVGTTVSLQNANGANNYKFPMNGTSDGRYLQVYRNGQRLVAGVDYDLVPISGDTTHCNSITVKQTAWVIDDIMVYQIPSGSINESNGLAGMVYEVPVGTVVWFATQTAPQDYVVADGASYVRSEFSELYNVIGTLFGAADGLHFNVPDIRGKFIRGYDPTNIVDPQTGRLFGTTQQDAFESHNHTYKTYGLGNNGLTGNAYTNTDWGYASSSSTGGAETRPVNINLLPCIKATSKTMGVKVAGVPMQVVTYTVPTSTSWFGNIDIQSLTPNNFKFMTSTTLKGLYLEIFLNGVRLTYGNEYTELYDSNVTATESHVVYFNGLTLETGDELVFKTSNQGPAGVDGAAAPTFVSAVTEYKTSVTSSWSNIMLTYAPANAKLAIINVFISAVGNGYAYIDTNGDHNDATQMAVAYVTAGDYGSIDGQVNTTFVPIMRDGSGNAYIRVIKVANNVILTVSSFRVIGFM